MPYHSIVKFSLIFDSFQQRETKNYCNEGTCMINQKCITVKYQVNFSSLISSELQVLWPWIKCFKCGNNEQKVEKLTSLKFNSFYR